LAAPPTLLLQTPQSPSTVIVASPRNTLTNNLALGTTKDLSGEQLALSSRQSPPVATQRPSARPAPASLNSISRGLPASQSPPLPPPQTPPPGKSHFDQQLPATFELLAPAALNNTLRGNVAAGSHRIGFHVAGDACRAETPSASLAAAPPPQQQAAPGARQAFEGNSAHSSLVSLVLADNLAGAPCTALSGFASWMAWDFGVLTMGGAETHVLLQDLVVAGAGASSLAVCSCLFWGSNGFVGTGAAATRAPGLLLRRSTHCSPFTTCRPPRRP
jgi:hypothetical protein